MGPLSTCTCRLHYSAIDVYIYIEPSLFLLPLELLCCSLVACFLNTSYSREGSWQGSRHQTSIFGAPGPSFCSPRPRFWCPQTSIFERFGVIPLLHYYFVTLLRCYIVTLLLCYFVTLLLARWRDRSFAALLDPPRQALRPAHGVIESHTLTKSFPSFPFLS